MVSCETTLCWVLLGCWTLSSLHCAYVLPMTPYPERGSSISPPDGHEVPTTPHPERGSSISPPDGYGQPGIHTDVDRRVPANVSPTLDESTSRTTNLVGSLVLDCPDHNPERFSATTWYVGTPWRPHSGSYCVLQKTQSGLYRVDANGVVSVYQDAHIMQSKNNVEYSVSRNKSLVIRVRNCNHDGYYTCHRSAVVGQRNEEHEFRVTNCTVKKMATKNRGHPLSNGNTAVDSAVVVTALTLMFVLLNVWCSITINSH